MIGYYREFAKKHVKQERARERAELAKAWNLMDPLGKGSLPIYDEKFIKLFKILKPMVIVIRRFVETFAETSLSSCVYGSENM